MARVSCYAGDGDYFVTPTSSKRRRRVSGGLLVVEVHDQLITPHPCVSSENLGENLVLRVPFLCYFGLMSVMLMRIVLYFARALI